MKTFLGIFFLLVFNLQSSSQNNNEFEFIGNLTVNSGDVISYKLIFYQTANNEISGYSFTDFTGKSLTKTSIEGTYDTINNTLSFKELANINTKVNEADSTFCFVSTNKLKIRNVKGITLVTGKFKGSYPSGEFCAEGMIYLVESKIVEKIDLLTYTKKKRKQNKKIAKDSIKRQNKKQDVVLKSSDKFIIEYKGDNIFMEVWDGSIEDNDMIKILLNDSTFKEKIILTNKKLKFALPNSEDELKLKITAINEGTSGINTVNFAVKNDLGTEEFTSKLKKGESFYVEFKRKK